MLRWRIALIIGGLLSIVSILTLGYFSWIHQSYVELFSNLRSTDAATIIAELDKRQVPYRLSDGGRAIQVPQNVVDATRLSLTNEEMPLKGVVGFELFNKSDMGLTEFAQRINYRRALQGEIARTIMALDTVESARVHLTLSDTVVFREDRKPSKASITIVPRARRALSQQNVQGIQQLVAAAVADLEPDNVVILNEGGAVISSNAPASIAVMPPALQEKTAIEAFYAGRVQARLTNVVPDGRFKVRVNAGWAALNEDLAQENDPFATWSPATRRFPLSVQITLESAVGVEGLSQIQARAAEAIGLRPDVGDAVSIAYGAVLPAETRALVPPPARPIVSPTPSAPATSAVGSEPGTFVLSLAAPLLVVLLGIAFLIHRRWRGYNRLSSRQREAFSNQFRTLLDQGDADAVASR